MYYIIGKIFKSNTVMKNLKLFVILVAPFISGIDCMAKIKILVIFEGESMICWWNVTVIYYVGGG